MAQPGVCTIHTFIVRKVRKQMLFSKVYWAKSEYQRNLNFKMFKKILIDIHTYGIKELNLEAKGGGRM